MKKLLLWMVFIMSVSKASDNSVADELMRYNAVRGRLLAIQADRARNRGKCDGRDCQPPTAGERDNVRLGLMLTQDREELMSCGAKVSRYGLKRGIMPDCVSFVGGICEGLTIVGCCGIGMRSFFFQPVPLIDPTTDCMTEYCATCSFGVVLPLFCSVCSYCTHIKCYERAFPHIPNPAEEDSDV